MEYVSLTENRSNLLSDPNIPAQMQISGIRLQGESDGINESPNKGVVEIEYNSSWRPVCQNKWGIKEALVACRQLNYQGGWTIDGVPPDVSLPSTIYAGDFVCGIVPESGGEFLH